MKRIGVVYGMENSFPAALVDHINARNLPGIRAEHVKIGDVFMGRPSGLSGPEPVAIRRSPTAG